MSREFSSQELNNETPPLESEDTPVNASPFYLPKYSSYVINTLPIEVDSPTENFSKDLLSSYVDLSDIPTVNKQISIMNYPADLVKILTRIKPAVLPSENFNFSRYNRKSNYTPRKDKHTVECKSPFSKNSGKIVNVPKRIPNVVGDGQVVFPPLISKQSVKNTMTVPWEIKIPENWDVDYKDQRYNLWRKCMFEVFQQQINYALIVPPEILGALEFNA